MGFGFVSIFPILFVLVFCTIFVMIIVQVVRGLSQWHSNNQQPVLTVDAEVVTKRENVTHSQHTSSSNNEFHHTSTSTTYYTTFQVESGDRMELVVSGTEYGQLAEGDRGRLTFQGTRYKSFERQ